MRNIFRSTQQFHWRYSLGAGSARHDMAWYKCVSIGLVTWVTAARCALCPQNNRIYFLYFFLIWLRIMLFNTVDVSKHCPRRENVEMITWVHTKHKTATASFDRCQHASSIKIATRSKTEEAELLLFQWYCQWTQHKQNMELVVMTNSLSTWLNGWYFSLKTKVFVLSLKITIHSQSSDMFSNIAVANYSLFVHQLSRECSLFAHSKVS